MRIACSSQSLDRQFAAGRMDLPGFIRYAAEGLAIPCVELEDKHFESASPRYLKRLAEEVEKRGLEVANIAFFCSFGYPTREENDAELARAAEWMEAARALGSPNFRIFSGWMGGPDREIGKAGPPVQKTEAAWTAMAGYVQAACEQARRRGLNAVIENHDHGGFLSESKDVLRLFSEVRADNLSLLLDTGNYTDGLAGIERTVHLVKRHVHLKAGRIAADGRDEVYDFDAILAVLRGSGFDGTISIEYEGAQDELSVLPRIVGYLKKAL
jgi:sugar phosphate isomerase/epimerase